MHLWVVVQFTYRLGGRLSQTSCIFFTHYASTSRAIARRSELRIVVLLGGAPRVGSGNIISCVRLRGSMYGCHLRFWILVLAFRCRRQTGHLACHAGSSLLLAVCIALFPGPAMCVHLSPELGSLSSEDEDPMPEEENQWNMSYNYKLELAFLETPAPATSARLSASCVCVCCCPGVCRHICGEFGRSQLHSCWVGRSTLPRRVSACETATTILSKKITDRSFFCIGTFTFSGLITYGFKERAFFFNTASTENETDYIWCAAQETC